MRRPFRRYKRFDCPSDQTPKKCDTLLSIWGLEWDASHPLRVPPRPYTEYWHDLLMKQPDRKILQLNNSEHVSKLVATIQSGIEDHLPDLRNRIQSFYPSSTAQSSITEEQAVNVLGFAILLWLHLDLKLQPHMLPLETLEIMVHQSVPQPSVTTVFSPLSADFCAKHLWRKGGLQVIWTDDINEHLKLKGDHSFFVFRHTGMLRVLNSNPALDPFPPGFIFETLETLYLLFRPLDKKKSRYNVRLMEKSCECDLELAMANRAQFDLSRYRHWWKRLHAIQLIYEKKRPSNLKEWWFDRRDRVQWATFWVAFVVLVLTIVFGLIQSITGIFQAYAAYHPPAPGS